MLSPKITLYFSLAEVKKRNLGRHTLTIKRLEYMIKQSHQLLPSVPFFVHQQLTAHVYNTCITKYFIIIHSCKCKDNYGVIDIVDGTLLKNLIVQCDEIFHISGFKYDFSSHFITTD